MKKLIYSFVILLGLLVGTFGFAASASATEPTSGYDIVESKSDAKASTSSSNTSVNGVSIRSKTKVVSYVQAKGATKAQMKPKKIRLKKRMTLWTSYKNTAGREVWHLKTYPRGKLLVWGKDGWYHDPLCYNKVKYRTKKSVPSSRKLYGAIKVVKSFTFTVTATSKAIGSASAKAHAWCNTATSLAEGWGSGASSYYALASATGSGRTWTEATARARSNAASRLWLKAKSITSIEAWMKTQAEGKATAEAAAKAVCTTIPTHDECPDIPGDQPEDYECSPPPPAPTYSCEQLSVTKGTGRSVTIGTFRTSAQNGAVFQEAVIEWGDGASTTTSEPVGKTHNFASDGTYTIRATARFMVNGTIKTASGSNCTASVKFDAPPPYECPPDTKWTDIDKDGKKEEGECFEAPAFVEFREFNDLYRSLPGTPTTMNHFVTVDTPAGHSFNVTWSTVWGSFATPTKTGQDGAEVGNTYTAPSEVPPAHADAGLAAGYDKITVTVTDNVTGQKITRSTAPFRIKEWPTTP